MNKSTGDDDGRSRITIFHILRRSHQSEALQLSVNNNNSIICLINDASFVRKYSSFFSLGVCLCIGVLVNFDSETSALSLSSYARARVCVYLWARNVDLRFNATLSNTYSECIVLSLSLSFFLLFFVFSFHADRGKKRERERLTSISTTYSTVRYSSTSSFKKECEETTTTTKEKEKTTKKRKEQLSLPNTFV